MGYKKNIFQVLNQKLKFKRGRTFTEIKNIRWKMTKSVINHTFAFQFILVIMLVLYKIKNLFLRLLF